MPASAWCPCAPLLPWLFEHDPVVVLSHAHLDHMGGAHEFTDCRVHAAEAPDVRRPGPVSLAGPRLLEILGLDAGQQPVPDLLLEGAPRRWLRPGRLRPLRCARADRARRRRRRRPRGDRRLRVLHLPGHTPGSISLHNRDSGHLFTGDVLFDGGLIDTCVGSDIASYVATMRTLLDVPVLSRLSRPRSGARPSGGVRRIASDYLRARDD